MTVCNRIHKKANRYEGINKEGLGVSILLLYLVLVILVNIPFGYWRANVQKLSPQWFFAVHLPVPLVAYLRHNNDFGMIAITIPLFVISYFYGQFLGGRVSIAMRRYGRVTSSLFHDLVSRSWIILIGR